MTKGIILAGGRATRLGPLTAQLNKALVSIGQRPIIAHHLELFRNAGVTETVVVCSPSSRQQVEDVVLRSHADMSMSVRFVEQDQALGPAHAVLVGADFTEDDQVYVLMADTFVDQQLPAIGGGWVGVASATSTRHWCYPRKDGTGYEEGEVDAGEMVCIGAYGFDSVKMLAVAAAVAVANRCEGQEALMAPMLNAYPHIDCDEEFDSWLDVGDVRALTAARRKRFITREFNSLELTEQGIMIKRGAREQLEPEMSYYERLSSDAQSLFPRFIGASSSRDSYSIEYVDLPSLAELYIYWPGRPDMWANIVADVIHRLGNDLWREPFYDEDVAVAWHNDMYSEKPWKRLKTWEERGNEVDWVLVERLGGFLAKHPPREFVNGHGDLNFGNILYGIGSGVIKLVDPRGDTYIDIDYELAKLRYSYRDGFSAICHNLFEVVDGELVLGPKRDLEAEAIDRILLNLSNLRRITAVEATLFLSATPLHNEAQGKALYMQGCKLAREALNDTLWARNG